MMNTNVLRLWRNWLSSYWALLIVLILAVLFFPLRGATVMPDSTTYLSAATNLSNGIGYVDAAGEPITIRGPVFPALLAVSLRLFGHSVESAMYVVRLFFVANILIIYFIGKQLFSKTVGLVGALLVLTSTIIHYWSAVVLLDNVLPFFILASNFILFFAIKNERHLYHFLAGIVLGIGFLVKDVAGLFIVTPIMIWLVYKPYRTRRSIISIALYGFTIAAFAISWLIYAGQNSDFNYFATMAGWVLQGGFESSSISASSNVGQEAISQPSILLSIVKIATDLTDRFVNFHEVYVVENLSIAPLFGMAWLYLLYRVVRYRKLVETYLFSLFLTFLPIMLFLGRIEFRAGQTLYLYLLSYLAIAYLLIAIRVPLVLYPLRSVHLRWMLVVGVLCVQLFVKPLPFYDLLYLNTRYSYIPALNTFTFSFWQPSQFHTRGWDSKAIRSTGEWLRQNTTDNGIILSDTQWLNAYYFHSHGQHSINEIEYIPNVVVDESIADVEPVTAFIWAHTGSVDPTAPLNRLMAFSQSHFLEQVKRQNAEYIIVGQHRNFLGLYLRTHPDFAPVAEFDDGRIQIFVVLPDAEFHVLNTFPLFVSNHIGEYTFNTLKQHGQGAYEQLEEKYFGDVLNLDEGVIQAIETNAQPIFRYSSIISHKQYASLVHEQAPTLLPLISQQHREKATQFPDNIWIQLGQIYLNKNNFRNEDARSAFVELLQNKETSLQTYLAMHAAYFDLEQELDFDQIVQQQFIEFSQNYLLQNSEQIESYWQLSDTFQRFGDSERAIQISSQTLTMWPQSAATMLRLAGLYHAENRLDEAKEMYNAYLSAQSNSEELPNVADIHVQLGKILLAQSQGVVQ